MRTWGEWHWRGRNAGFDGLTPGFLDGPRHPLLLIGRNPRHRGVLVGEVSEIGPRGVFADLTGPVKRGDGLVFDRGTCSPRVWSASR